jgi:hypothetical protein
MRECLRELRMWPGCETVAALLCLRMGVASSPSASSSTALQRSGLLTVRLAAFNARRRDTFT